MKNVNINGEECRPIKGFSRYVISVSGRIYRIVPISNKEYRLLKDNPTLKYFHEPKIYEDKHDPKRSPEMKVGLTKDNGKIACAKVGTFVAMAFGLRPNNMRRYKINFKDGNFRNYHLDNLEYIYKQPNGANINADDIPKIKRLIKLGIPLRHIGKVYNVSEMTIGRIKTGENWNHGKRIIQPPKAPFHIEDGKIRKLVATFEAKKVDVDNNRPFNLKHTPDRSKVIISGTINGYKLTKKHGNVSRARLIIDKLNKYFFNDIIANRVNYVVISKLNQKNIKPLNELYQR